MNAKTTSPEAAAAGAYVSLAAKISQLESDEAAAAAELAQKPDDAQAMGKLLDLQGQLREARAQQAALDEAVARARETQARNIAASRRDAALEARAKATALATMRVALGTKIDEALENLEVAIAAFSVLSQMACAEHGHYVTVAGPSPFDNARACIDPGGGVIIPTLSRRLAQVLKPLQIHGAITLAGFTDTTTASVAAAALQAASRYDVYARSLSAELAEGEGA